MATLLNSESRRLYSWWWDSHISPKNSKWLQENLTEIDAKVKAMIKIINEDADSFARRAEMYYKKRPELMKLVEDFYRAYRALAERYDHATGELHLAHKTMAEVFPNQVPSMLNDDIPSSSQPSSPVNPHLVRAFFDPDRLCKESDAGSSRKGLKQLNDMFQIGEDMLRELKSAEEKLRCKDSDSEKDLSLLSDESRNPQTIGKAEEEMQSLKEALTTVETEKVNILAQYKQSLEKISSMEKELHSVQNDAKELDKHASEAENEVKTLRESLLKLEAERDSSFTQYKDSSEKLASLEAKMAMAQKEMTNWRDRAVKAETECQNFKQEISVHEVEKEETLVRYEQSLENINNLERKLLLAEENAKQIYEQINQAEDEIKMLKEKISVLNKEKEDAYLQYQLCLDTISKLQNELMEAKEDIRRLNDEILSGSAKMRSAEDQCALLEETNESMKLKADELVQKIAEKDQQLFKKNAELDELMSSLQDEESRFMQVKATLNSLQSLHSRSQEEQRDLSLELKHVLQLLKDLELCKQDLELDIQHLREENTGLNDLKLASCIAERDMVHEILSLKKIKENLEAEIKKQTEQNDALELQFHQLKEEIEVLHKKYRDLLQQVESAGIDPKCVGSSIKDLQDEYSRLKEIFTVEKEEKEVLLKKFEDMEGLLEKSAILESSLSDVIIELERSKEKTKVLQESCDSLSEEKLTLVAEKSTLLSQLQMITESMQCLLEKNALMENSLSSANIELEGLRVKSKSLEDACQLLRDEKTSLQIERSNLISLLEFVGKNVENLEMRFAKFEDKCDGLEKEKECTRNQVEELRASLSAEKMNNRTRLSGLEDRIDVLKVENKCRKKDFEEQLENAVNAQVEIFILQKFIQDMEEKNYTLIAECQKHTENAKYSKKVISELESENMMQHLEMEFLLDRVDKLGRGIFQVLKALEIDNASETEPEIFVARIPSTIKGIQRDLVESRDENQQLLIQNTVFSAVIRHLSSEGSEVATRNKVLDHELFLLNQKHVVLEHEKDQLADRKGQLDTVVAMKEREQEIMKVQLELLISKQEAVQKECDALQEKHLADVEENRCLQHRLSEAEEENHTLVEDNSAIIVEALSFSNQSEVYKSLWVQKALELERVSEELNHLREAYTVSENEARVLREKLAVKETENLHLGELTQNLEVKNQELNVFNDQLNCKILAEGERVNQKKMELSGAEERIKALQDVNTELHMTIEGLEMHSEGLDVIHGNLEGRISELNQYKEHQEKEIIALQEANENLENDLCLLNEEIEAYKIREVILSSELHERSCEFELWEAEASSFYFDFQTSVVREALYEDKVHELSGLCDDLEDVSIRRSIEIETMKDKISFLESESDGLKSHLAAYFPAIASLKNIIVSLEHNPVLQTKLHLTGASQQQVEELNVSDVNERYPSSDKEKSSSVPDGLSELQDLQSRIESIEAAVNEIEEPKCSKIAGSINVKVGDGTHMKDIPLDYVSDASSTSNRRRCSDKVDQMLELWETSEQDTDVDPSEIEKELGVDKVEESKKMRQSDNKVILERLASDSQKLERLKVSIQELKRKSEMKKRRKRYKAVEYEQVKVQLEDMEDSVVQVAGVNSELIKAIEESPSAINSTDEKISRLGLDVQRIEDMVIRMEDEKNENKEGKKGFLRIRRGVALKVRLCGCFSLR